MKKFILLACMTVFCTCMAKPLFEMSEKNIPKLQMSPGTDMIGGRFFMQNKGEGAVIPNSQNWHLTDKGFTIAATVKLNRRHVDFGTGYGIDGKFLYDHDIIAAKDGEFVFGRRSDNWSDQLYFNFMRNGKWSVPLVGTVGMPSYGNYAHVAITVERRVQDNRGINGYNVTYYLNGEPEKEQLVNCGGPVTLNNASWRLGAGLGIRNDKWSYDGEMTDVFMFDRVLNENEILKLATESRPAKIAKQAGVPLTPAFSSKIASLNQNASVYGKWALDVISRNCRNGESQTVAAAELDCTANVLKINDAKKFAAAWNRVSKISKILFSSRSMLMVNMGKHSSGVPICGWFDLKRNTELFGMMPPNWGLSYHMADGQPGKQNSSGTAYTLQYKSIGEDAYSGVITWLKPGMLKAVSNFTFRNGRLEMDLNMESLNKSFFLDQITFPYVSFRKLAKGQDKLLFPKMSGVVFPRPITNQPPQLRKVYPNGDLNMQFHAYYDDLGGIYLGAEDPYAGIKHFVTRGRNGELEMRWSHPVAYNQNEKGGSKFSLSGKAALEIFDGDWFDAGRIYRRFLASKAKWWIKELPRASTPEWFRNNTFWILQLCFNEWDHYNTVTSLKELREYFELPFGIHYYEWFDRTRGEFPHFYTKTRALQTLVELKDANIYVKPYIDNRLWAQMDGHAPGKDHTNCLGFHDRKNGRHDFQFSRLAKKYAARTKENDLYLEGSKTRWAVMCPAVPEWQNFIYNMVKRLAGQGFDAIYHDEVATGRPVYCYNPDHGHQINSPRNWLENGYWKMLAKVAELRSKYPGLCHDSEEASEPYLKYFDGFGPFRWVDPGQVPLFVSIYSGRAQYTGRMYDHVKPGHKESFYDKMATQLVNAEQMGWFTANYLNNPEHRLFTKKLMHLRYTLLNFFNTGEMDRPLKFKGDFPTRSLMWGCLQAQRITTPKIHHSVFKLDNGTRAVIFLNATPEKVTVEPVIPAYFGKIAVCSGKNNAVNYNRVTQVTLEPRQFEVWVASNDENNLRKEAERIHEALVRIDKFQSGKLMFERDNNPQEIPAEGLHYTWDEYPVWHTQPAYEGLGCFELIGHPEKTHIKGFSLKLEPDSTYELEVAIRKDLDTESLLRVCNYDKNGKLSRYAVIGDKVPSDGRWHHCKVTFKTNKDAYRSALYLYLNKTTKTVRIDELKIKKVK